MTATADVVDQLVAVCGADRVRPGGPDDVIAGVPAGLVARPLDTETMAGTIRVAQRLGLHVLPRGAGTKSDWGRPPARLDLLVDLGGLDLLVEHAPGDLIVRVGAGMPLHRLQTELARTGQCLAVDEVVPGSTVGGAIATGLSGPRRMQYGAVRDLLIGVTVVRADGVVARSGGRVVKNVAGYDLCKLYTGSYGTLGVITEATFRLHPIPPATAWVTASPGEPGELEHLLAVLVASPLALSALEVERTGTGRPVTVVAAVEGSPTGVAARAEHLSTLLGGGRLLTAPPPTWGTLPGTATVRLTTELGTVASVLREVDDLAARLRLDVAVRGSAGSGVLHAGLPDEAPVDRIGAFLDGAREVARRGGGFATLLRACPEVSTALDVWGPVPGLALMRRIKHNFDPDGLFSAGRFVGGI